MNIALPLPILDETRCTSCGDCVASCPTFCLELGKLLPFLPRPADCVSCGLCALVCPETAIGWRVEQAEI